MDGSEAARGAFVFVSDWAREFDASVWFIQLTDESTTRHGATVTDVPLRGRQLANTFTVSGATRATRDWQLVSSIAEAADTFRADLVVLGFGRGVSARHRSSNSVREQLSALIDTPVLVAPKASRTLRPAHRAPRRAPVEVSAIELGPTRRDERLVGV